MALVESGAEDLVHPVGTCGTCLLYTSNLLSKQILSRKKVISLLNQELDEIEKDILNIQGQLRTLKRELGDKQTNYGKAMRGLDKRHSLSLIHI